MSDGGVPLTKGIETQLSAVASHLHEMAQEQAGTRSELKEFKDRLLGNVESLDKRVMQLERENAELGNKVSALQSRQAPLTGPAAWIAVIVSGAVAFYQFFGK